VKSRAWPIATAAFGVATVATLYAFTRIPEIAAAYPDGGFTRALSAFQRARTMEDLALLFGAPPDREKLAAMTAGNWLDLVVFIPVYTAFLVSAAAMLAGSIRTRLAWLAIAPALIAALADGVETWAQLQMTADWSRASALLPMLAPASWTKYFALGAHALGCTIICFTGPRRRWVLGAVGIAPIAGVLAERFGSLDVLTVMTAVFGVFWIALLITAFIDLARAKGVSA
jgi:hypothetical protein